MNFAPNQLIRDEILSSYEDWPEPSSNIKGREKLADKQGKLSEKGDFAFSHHGTYPVSGKLCNTFDLDRLHRFGALDDDIKE